MDKLIFVYNANSGLVNMALDGLHKLFSPHTYPCQLCALTYGSVAMKNEWKTFINNVGIPIVFLHKDQFKQRFDLDEENLPAVFAQTGDHLKLWIDAQTLNACRTLDALITLIKERISNAS